MNIRSELTAAALSCGLDPAALDLPDREVGRASIEVMMISEVPHKIPENGFYGTDAESEYVKSALGLFSAAGVEAGSINDILGMGIYITTAVKTPKEGYTVAPETIRAQLPLLEAEIALFPNLRAIMLMGDVAKKAVNMIAKARTGKNVVPSLPTGRIHTNEYFWGGVRVFPSYIMTGKNLLIEPFKRDTIAADIRLMREFIEKSINPAD